MTNKRPQPKKLTIREAKLVQLKAKGTPHKQAFYKAGYSPNSAPNTAITEVQKTLKKPHVKDALNKALIKHDINLDNALQPIAKGLKAVKTNEYTGEITEDLTTQLKASDRALKLLGVNSEAVGSFHLHLHNNKEKYDL